MNHIVSFSGGKDSTALFLLMKEKDMRIDEIVCADTTKEFPQLYEHIEKIKQYTCMPITILQNKTFDYWMFDHEKTRGKNKGQKGYAWASQGQNRWCTSVLKRDLIKSYLNKKYGNGSYIQYIGIGMDELNRVDDNQFKRYPLIDWKMTEGEALKYCYDKGFDWGGLYTKFNRVSCWCCPFSSLRELRNLYIYYPDLWGQLKDMDNRSWNQFRAKESVQDLENRFKKELDELYLKMNYKIVI